MNPTDQTTSSNTSAISTISNNPSLTDESEITPSNNISGFLIIHSILFSLAIFVSRRFLKVILSFTIS